MRRRGLIDVNSLIGLIGSVITISVAIIGIYRWRKKIKALYLALWKKSSALTPQDILERRPFRTYYLPRREDDGLRRRLHENQNVLIVGPPLSGKSRLIYEILKKLTPVHNVLIPKYVDRGLTDIQLPMQLKLKKRPRILLFDDLNRFIETKNFEHFLAKAIQDPHLCIVAACRSRMEFDKVEKALSKQEIPLKTIFGSNIIELRKISPKVRKKYSITLKEIG